MKDTQLFMSMSNTIWPSVWLAVLPIGAILYQHGTLSAPVFLTIMILSLGIVGPILGAIKFTDNISQLGTIVGEVEICWMPRKWCGRTTMLIFTTCLFTSRMFPFLMT